VEITLVLVLTLILKDVVVEVPRVKVKTDQPRTLQMVVMDELLQFQELHSVTQQVVAVAVSYLLTLALTLRVVTEA
jgi:hypothetical protein